MAARGEYYSDEQGVIITPGFKTTGYSLNVDYAPAANMLIRIEGRTLDPKEAEDNTAVTASVAISF